MWSRGEGQKLKARNRGKKREKVNKRGKREDK